MRCRSYTHYVADLMHAAVHNLTIWPEAGDPQHVKDLPAMALLRMVSSAPLSDKREERGLLQSLALGSETHKLPHE